MWSQISRYLPEFNSAVLTVVDAIGFPSSRRCRPRPDEAAHVLRLDLPADGDIPPGPACLLFHRHDEWLWNLKSFVLRGALEKSIDGWRFRPVVFIPGMAIGRLSFVRFFRQGRRAARRYLAKRGLARPRIAWQDWLDALGEDTT